MKTKFYIRFLNRAAHLDADIELVDIFKIAIANGALKTDHSQYIFDHVNPEQHPRLATRACTKHNKTLVINHLKATLCASFLKDIYEDVLQYLLEILKAATRRGLNANRLIGEHKVTYEANDILAAGNWNNIIQMVSQSVFRKLEGERSTKDLIQKINTKLDLGVSGSTIDAALPYFQLRHLLVHSDGKADQKFCESFPSFGVSVGQKIQLDYSVLQNARTAIFALINEFDQQIIAKNIVLDSEIQP